MGCLTDAVRACLIAFARACLIRFIVGWAMGCSPGCSIERVPGLLFPRLHACIDGGVLHVSMRAFRGRVAARLDAWLVESLRNRLPCCGVAGCDARLRA